VQSRDSCGCSGTISWRRAFARVHYDEEEIDFKHSGVGFEIEDSHSGYAHDFGASRTEWPCDSTFACTYVGPGIVDESLRRATGVGESQPQLVAARCPLRRFARRSGAASRNDCGDRRAAQGPAGARDR
jgi:hypothetical protein